MNVVVILAGGVGSRLGLSTPKQFFKVAGKMVIEHTVEVFEKHAGIDEIAIVINPACMAMMDEIVLKNAWRKVKKILRGGAERYDSSMAAIGAYEDLNEANLIFHDAVRRLVTNRVVDDVFRALEVYNAVGVALPSVDTVVEVEGSFIDKIPDRSRFWRMQTPQAFKLGTIREAYRIALQDSAFKATDDCGVVKKYLPKEKIYIVSGEESNIKLTYKEDTYLLDKYFQLKKYAE